MKAWNLAQPVKIEAAMYFHLSAGDSLLTGQALTAFNSVTP